MFIFHLTQQLTLFLSDLMLNIRHRWLCGWHTGTSFRCHICYPLSFPSCARSCKLTWHYFNAFLSRMHYVALSWRCHMNKFCASKSLNFTMRILKANSELRRQTCYKYSIADMLYWHNLEKILEQSCDSQVGLKWK